MGILKFYAPVSPDALTAILKFVPRLQKLRREEVFIHSPGEMIAEEPLTFRMHGEYHPLLDRFRLALYRHGFIQDYNWPNFHKRALAIYEQPQLLRRVTIRTCVKLLTFHVRRDRFMDGHFACMIQEGHMTAILQHMVELKDRMDKKQIQVESQVSV